MRPQRLRSAAGAAGGPPDAGGAGASSGGSGADGGGPARVPRPTAAERRALAALADLSRRFERLTTELAELRASLPRAPEAEHEAMCNGSRPPTVAFYLARAIDCLLLDEVRPLAKALADLAAVTPAGLVTSWRREVRETGEARGRFTGRFGGAETAPGEGGR